MTYKDDKSQSSKLNLTTIETSYSCFNSDYLLQIANQNKTQLSLKLQSQIPISMSDHDFSPDEDKLLLFYINKYGHNFKKFSVWMNRPVKILKWRLKKIETLNRLYNFPVDDRGISKDNILTINKSGINKNIENVNDFNRILYNTDNINSMTFWKSNKLELEQNENDYDYDEHYEKNKQYQIESYSFVIEGNEESQKNEIEKLKNMKDVIDSLLLNTQLRSKACFEDEYFNIKPDFNNGNDDSSINNEILFLNNYDNVTKENKSKSKTIIEKNDFLNKKTKMKSLSINNKTNETSINDENKSIYKQISYKSIKNREEISNLLLSIKKIKEYLLKLEIDNKETFNTNHFSHILPFTENFTKIHSENNLHSRTNDEYLKLDKFINFLFFLLSNTKTDIHKLIKNKMLKNKNTKIISKIEEFMNGLSIKFNIEAENFNLIQKENEKNKKNKEFLLKIVDLIIKMNQIILLYYNIIDTYVESN